MERQLARRVRTLCALTCLSASIVFALGACRSGRAGDGSAPDPTTAKRTSIAPPWTAEVLESHEYLYLELASGRRGILFQPEYKHDEAGDYLTSKNDPTVHLTLADVRVLDALEVPPESSGPPVQSLAGAFAALWIGALLFLPAIALFLIFK